MFLVPALRTVVSFVAAGIGDGVDAQRLHDRPATADVVAVGN